MQPQGFRLGMAALAVAGSLLIFAAQASAQEPGALAASANAGVRAMSGELTAALNAGNEAAAKAAVRRAIAAGQSAVAALEALTGSADDLVRSRSEAALDQTSNAVAKAEQALNETGDTFRGRVEAALAEVNEAIVEFAPVLGQVPADVLPRSGEGDLTETSLAVIGIVGLALAIGGVAMRRRLAVAPSG